MEFEQVTIPATEPETLAAWYERFSVDADHADTAGGSTPQVQLGETTLRMTSADTAPPAHLAVRLAVEADQAADWLADRATILPVDGRPSRWFEFLEATAIYFDDPEQNVLEGLCYADDQHRDTDSEGVIDGLTEIGIPAPDPLALVEWFEQTVGLSAWGTPSETFAWVGTRTARFVVIPVGQTWYPTDREAALLPLSATVIDDSAVRGRHRHPRLPCEIRIRHS